MDFHETLDWAFQRHLNPLSWYIRPLFLTALCFFAFKRKLWMVILIFCLMMSSMVWFPPPDSINAQMQEVLQFEKKLLSKPFSAVMTLTLMLVFVLAILAAFWKHSLKWGLVIVNATLIGKVGLSLFFTGKSGWAPLWNTLFGLLIINGFATIIYLKKKKEDA